MLFRRGNIEIAAVDALRRGTFFDSEFMRIIEQDLKDGTAQKPHRQSHVFH